MHRITGYILPILYALLFGAVWFLQNSKHLPESIAGLKEVINYSLLIMVAIFWAVYFLAKRNLFDPLVAAMDKRRGFVAERLKGYEAAEGKIQEARRTFDLKLKEVRDDERQKLEALGRELSAERDQAVTALKADLQNELQVRRAALEAEAERAKRDLDPAGRKLAMDIVARVLKDHVA